MAAKYDDPEFLVRGIYHFYAGWFDGDAAHLKPPRTADLASELAALAGGAEKLAERATHLSEAGNFRLAVQLPRGLRTRGRATFQRLMHVAQNCASVLRQRDA
uniref:alkyl sulfatase dimerization domain-containing protein n=1 Tax=Ensifer adhaerens TaxID=106592 RepID=UPI003F49B1AD